MTPLNNRRTALNLALVMTTAAWLIVIAEALLSSGGPPIVLAWGGAALLVWLPLSLSRRLRALELAPRYKHIVTLLTFVLTLFVATAVGFYNQYGLYDWSWMQTLAQAETFSPDTGLNQVATLIIVVFCWWLGGALGDLRLTPENLWRYFYLGFFLIVSPSFYLGYRVIHTAPFLYVAFLFCGLMMLGLGQVQDVARRSGKQGVNIPFSPYWLGQIGLAAISALAATALGWLGGLHKSFGGLLLIGTLITLLILSPCMVAFDIAGKMLQTLEVAEPTATPTPTPPGLAPEDDIGGAPGGTEEQGSINYWAIAPILGGLSSVFALIVWAYRRWKELFRDMRDKEGRMTMSAREVLNAQLDAQLERIQRWMPGASGLRRRLTARSIRRIYVSMTALAAERGFVRLPTTTPYEYLPSAKRAFPGAEAQVALITEAYVAVHYGEIPETSQALAEIRQAWSQLRQQAARQPAYVVKEQAVKG